MRRCLQCYRRQSTTFVNSTTCEQNTLIYDSLRVLLYAVCLYGVYRAFDTLPLSLYYVLLVLLYLMILQYLMISYILARHNVIKLQKTSHLLIVLTAGALLIMSQAQVAVFV